MLAAILGPLIYLPGLIVAPVLILALDLYRIGYAIRELFDDAMVPGSSQI